MKKCYRCGAIKPLPDFYPCNHMSDGHLNICKECVKKREREKRAEKRQNPEYVEQQKSRGREKYYRLYRGKKQDRDWSDSSKNYNEKYPEKRKAKGAVNRILVPNGMHKHHWSYLPEHHHDIIIIPANLHYKIHRYMRYNSKEKKYSTLSGHLLNSRQEHEAYIEKVKALP